MPNPMPRRMQFSPEYEYESQELSYEANVLKADIQEREIDTLHELGLGRVASPPSTPRVHLASHTQQLR